MATAIKRWTPSIIFIILILIFISFSTIIRLSTDYLWFDALGFSSIFLITLKTKFAIFGATAGIFLVFAVLNAWIATKLHHAKDGVMRKKITSFVIVAASLVVGISFKESWWSLLQYMNQNAFMIKDPIFLQDVAFYVFSLPFFLVLWKFAFTILAVTAVIVLLIYLQSLLSTLIGKKQYTEGDQTVIPPTKNPFITEMSRMKRGAQMHLASLGVLLFLLVGVRHYLARYSVMFSEQGIVVGAGYTDVMVYLPVITAVAIFAIVIAVILFLWMIFFSKSKKVKKRHILATVIVIYLIVSWVGPTLIPAAVQQLRVAPNELSLEKPFIENNILFTRIAYGLTDVEEYDFDAEATLSAEDLRDERQTIDNVRILDWRPLTQTYKQTQEIRLYYDLSGIDVDRYLLDNGYTQVMVAPREMDQKQLAQNAKTWVNLHTIYTHGYGIVMSPVNKVTSQGLPDYMIKDIPPLVTSGDESLRVDEPRIYYGEKDNDYVIVNTDTEEFDYPKGNANEYTKYSGTGGIVLDTFWKKLIMAARFRDLKILLSSDVTKQSKILFARNIQERISKITPFIALDHDPYVVLSEGRIFWIQDGYTLTGNFPYSQKYGAINYMRNSVKIVVDAYNGDVTYYISDDQDPLISTISGIFPGQFKPLSEMSDDLRTHIRYPEDLFTVQSSIFSTYHMDDVNVFYNKEDAWQIPYEIYGVGQQVTMEPYYIIMRLPGMKDEEFVLMSPFTPIKKDNMVAWMSARSDGEHYGKLILFKFPKDKLVYGPLQVEARIDQDSEISEQLTLWSQQGSQVMRGNLLVIPIKDSLLYIEPLYIQAEKGQLPEMKRVLVSDGETVVMEKDLETSLKMLFGIAKKESDGSKKTDDYSNQQLIAEAASTYDAVLAAMEKKDWVVLGSEFDKLGELLVQLQK